MAPFKAVMEQGFDSSAMMEYWMQELQMLHIISMCQNIPSLVSPNVTENTKVHTEVRNVDTDFQRKESSQLLLMKHLERQNGIAGMVKKKFET